ncbi:unnamed protein product [Lampetra fluviatilis]
MPERLQRNRDPLRQPAPTSVTPPGGTTDTAFTARQLQQELSGAADNVAFRVLADETRGVEQVCVAGPTLFSIPVVRFRDIEVNRRAKRYTAAMITARIYSSSSFTADRNVQRTIVSILPTERRKVKVIGER